MIQIMDIETGRVLEAEIDGRRLIAYDEDGDRVFATSNPQYISEFRIC